MMKRTSIDDPCASLALALALPGGGARHAHRSRRAPADHARRPSPAVPPAPCLAVSRTTGFQVKVGDAHNPLGAPRDGSIVAWTITLGKPTATQIKFFNTNEGGVAEAAIAVLRAAAQAEPDLQADRAEPAGEARTVLRQDRPVPAANHDPGQEGRHRRADRADLGAGAGARLRQRHLVAGEPPQEAVHQHQHARPRTPRSAPRCSTTACTRPRA